MGEPRDYGEPRGNGEPSGNPGGEQPGRPAGEPGGRPPGGDRDTLGDWLAGQVPSLPPPPGTLERIRKRARQRKLSRAAGAAAGAVVLIAGLATLPRLALSQLQPATPPGAVAGQTLNQTPAQRADSPPHPAGSGTPAPAVTPNAVPVNFAPASVTFVGTGTGWVIGQAGVPGHCGPPKASICTSLARTDDGGRSWHGVPAPVTGPPDGASGVGQLRFLNTGDGWAFGPQLWATHDGGQHWARIPTHGMRVTALETSGSTAYAVWASCSGGGASFAADCTSFTLYSSPAGSDSWQPVPGATGGLTAGGAPSSAQLLLTGATSYLLPPSGVLLAAPATGGAQWQPVTGGLLNAAPCSPGAPGQASGALLAVTGTDHLVIMCPGAGSGSGSAGSLYASADGGKTWQPAGQAAVPGTAASLSGSLSGALVLATSKGIGISADGGASWQPARVAGSPPGGFSYVGMTTATQGVAVPADPGQGAVWFTYDGGSTWAPSGIHS
jgi:photosystem II stability/assembly factor-like uncharacterized protein